MEQGGICWTNIVKTDFGWPLQFRCGDSDTIYRKQVMPRARFKYSHNDQEKNKNKNKNKNSMRAEMRTSAANFLASSWISACCPLRSKDMPNGEASSATVANAREGRATRDGVIRG